MTQAFSVPSISCQHCVNAITESVSGLPGVQQVQVDLASKKVEVKTNGQVANDQILEAINEAGYEDAVII